jgi:hypothetical protein
VPFNPSCESTSKYQRRILKSQVNRYSFDWL